MSSISKLAAKLPPIEKGPKRTVRVSGIFPEDVILKLDVNSVSEIEDKIGASIISLFGKDRIGFGTLRYLWWGALIWKNPILDIKVVGKALQQALQDGKSYQDLMQPVAEALAASGLFATKEEEGEPEGEDDDEEEATEKGIPLASTPTDGEEKTEPSPSE